MKGYKVGETMETLLKWTILDDRWEFLRDEFKRFWYQHSLTDGFEILGEFKVLNITYKGVVVTRMTFTMPPTGNRETVIVARVYDEEIGSLLNDLVSAYFAKILKGSEE